MNIALLISGSLGELILYNLVESHTISFVLTDKRSVNIMQYCEARDIPVYLGNPRNREIDEFLNGRDCEIMISVNYLFLIDQRLIRFAKLCFNVHGSLLPKYRGRTPHVWAIINNETVTGVTAHLIDEGCDTGDIIDQHEISIEPEDTGFTILEKFKPVYISIVDRVLENYNQGDLNFTTQNENKATFFGKRVPTDGKIDWNWSAERIVNWVRAQAFPYPGAYSIYKGQLIIIDRLIKSDLGFHYQVENGTILSTDPLLVKCCNSTLELTSLRTESPIFEINEKFS